MNNRTANNQTETILLIDDDPAFLSVLSRALEKRHYSVICANNSSNATTLSQQHKPSKVVLDLRIEQESGLDLIPKLLHTHSKSQIVILTGYSSIATAVEAIKLGAINYLCKPADTEQILRAFITNSNTQTDIAFKPISVNRLSWEHIQTVLLQHNGNISAAARALGMHRRTLQRKLQKRPVRK